MSKIIVCAIAVAISGFSAGWNLCYLVTSFHYRNNQSGNADEQRNNGGDSGNSSKEIVL